MGKIKIKKERCKGCGLCILYCPSQLIELMPELNKTGFHPANFKDKNGRCKACRFCALICPEVCIEVYR
jgi:2-oxoglutarate ferredoxin oxidoreductase subunit delta